MSDENLESYSEYRKRKRLEAMKKTNSEKSSTRYERKVDSNKSEKPITTYKRRTANIETSKTAESRVESDAEKKPDIEQKSSSDSEWKKATVSKPPKKMGKKLAVFAGLVVASAILLFSTKNNIKLPDFTAPTFSNAVTSVDSNALNNMDDANIQIGDDDFTIFTEDQADQIINSVESGIGEIENQEQAGQSQQQNGKNQEQAGQAEQDQNSSEQNGQVEKEEEKETPIEDLKEYEGQFELSIEGATGLVGNTKLSFVDERTGEQINLDRGQTYTILGISEDQEEFNIITQDGKIGKVPTKDAWINLPDIIPSIIYKISNNSEALYKARGESLDGITGEKLYEDYDCFQYNEKLGRNEFLAPTTFSMAKKIQAIQKDALSQGKSLVIYETFRPYSAQKAVANALMAKFNNDENALVRALNEGYTDNAYGTSWFIAKGSSNHQFGIAMDCSLADVTNSRLGRSGEYKYIYHAEGDYTILEMPSPMHELSAQSAVYKYGVNSYRKGDWKNGQWIEGFANSENAQLLQKLCTDHGLDPLSSEWWHFNDVDDYNYQRRDEVINQLKAEGKNAGDFPLGDCKSVDDISKLLNQEQEKQNSQVEQNQTINTNEDVDFER